MAEEKEEEEMERKAGDGEEQIMNHLVECEDVIFRSQQRGEEDLTAQQKRAVAQQVWRQSKSAFLGRFGRHLRREHLEHFQQWAEGSGDEGHAVAHHLARLERFFSGRGRDVRNRRYSALQRLLQHSDHFSEAQMMRRNPLLYEHLVGQYLSEEERKQRDGVDTKNITFVNLLLESMDRDAVRDKRQQQQDLEESTMQEDEDEDEDKDKNKIKDKNKKDEDSDSWDEEPTDKVTKWGEFPGSSTSYVSTSERTRRYDHFFAPNEAQPKKEVVMITADERRLLRDEFTSLMYQEFLDGNDADFDYSTVDDNEEYDNLELKTLDAEDSYFDSETPEDVAPDEDKEAQTASEEDELEVFMKRLNQHPTLQQLNHL